METVTQTYLRDDLIARRRQLATFLESDQREELLLLLRRVDRALHRLDAGTLGICEECQGTVEEDRLLSNPFTRVCLDCLSEVEARALEHDLETAAGIQAALLPPRQLVHGDWELAYEYRPLGPVSGDHIDVLAPKSASEPLYFLFGDVVGKGVSASLLMTHLHALFRALVALDLPLAEMLRRGNRIFSESTLARSFATLVAGKLRPDGELEMANLGHCPPLLLRDGDVKTIGSTAMPFGLFPEVDLAVRRFQLEAGDLLVLYTDGLSEARDGSGREYGAQRLATALHGLRGRPIGDTLESLLADADAFRDGHPRSDDLTLAACRRVG